MNVCIFGSGSDFIPDIYKDAVRDLSEQLADRGFNLVFGGGEEGIMGVAGRTFHEKGATVTGVVPKFFGDEGIEPTYEGCDVVIPMDTLGGRQEVMENISDAFIICPGGIGTLEEFCEIIVLKELCRTVKTVVVFDVNGFFEGLTRHFENMRNESFLRGNFFDHFRVFNEKQIPELLDYIEKDISEEKHKKKVVFDYQ